MSTPSLRPALLACFVVLLAACDKSPKTEPKAEPKAAESKAKASVPDAPEAKAPEAKAPEATAPEAEAPEPTAGEAGEPAAAAAPKLIGEPFEKAGEALGALASTPDATATLATLELGGGATIVITGADCDGKPEECTSRLPVADAAAFRKWVEDTVIDPPGWDAGPLDACKDACCTFESLAAAADAEELSVPHELYELREVCFIADAGGVVTGVKHLSFIAY